jgi:hypothetical protein
MSDIVALLNECAAGKEPPTKENFETVRNGLMLNEEVDNAQRAGDIEYIETNAANNGRIGHTRIHTYIHTHIHTHSMTAIADHLIEMIC